MLRLTLAELRHRSGRFAALALGIALATASFALLTGASSTQRLEVHGAVAQRFRTTYDLLVRPRGHRTGLEKAASLVAPNATSGVFGGISLAQLKRMRAIPGIEVAAPIAMVGYVLPDIEARIPLENALTQRRRQLLRVRTTWVSSRGVSRVPEPPSYVYVTHSRLQPPFSLIDQPHPPVDVRYDVPAALEERRHGSAVPVCPSEPGAYASSPFARAARQRVECWSTRSGIAPLQAYLESGPARSVAVHIPFAFPLLLAAVDPVAEAKLTGLSRAVVSGRYLRPADKPVLLHRTPGHAVARQSIPVLASTQPFVDLSAEVTVERLNGAVADTVARTPRTRALNRLLAAQPAGPVILHRTLGDERPYRHLLQQLAAKTPFLASYWTAADIRFRRSGPRRLAPVSTHNAASVWTSTLGGVGAADIADIPQSAREGGFRRLERYSARNDSGAKAYPALHAIGQFDAARIEGFLQPDSRPLSTYVPPLAEPVDTATRKALRGRPLLPDGNPAGYLTPPPLLLTTLASLPILQREPEMAEVPPFAGAPVSVVRVRVAGVHGPDPVSRERIRLAAQRVVHATGLDVDVTAGASPTQMRIDLPRGQAGRPPLSLNESWVKQGVGLAILRAIDRKSVILFALVLLVCGLFVTNAATAAARARRTELAVMACVGWRPRHVFGMLIAELAGIGLLAGLAGGVIALIGGHFLGLEGTTVRAALAVPAAIALAVLAGCAPALLAGRTTPIEATRPAVRSPVRGRAADSVLGIAMTNLVRVPGRTALGALSLGVGVLALTLLFAVVIAFRGTVVGSLLGDAVALQVRGADYAAVAAIMTLGAVAVADITWLNMRDRAGELATMRAAGWRDSHLVRLICFEAAGVGFIGAATGAILGLAAAAVFARSVPPSLLLVSLGAVAAGIAVAASASLVPALTVANRPTAALLAEE